MGIKDIIGHLVFPVLCKKCWCLLRGKKCSIIYLSGNYSSWIEALKHSSGYDNDIILSKTTSALLKVKKGEAVYERDSVIFDEIQYSWPLLAGIMWAAACSEGELNVLDYGGSLGSTYFQNREFLRDLKSVRWNIVEQPKYVEVGKELFEDEHIKFYFSVDECLSDTNPHLAILSGVLQYVDNPYVVLERLTESPVRWMIIDRTPFGMGDADRLCVQHVPPHIYEATYPCWIFSLNKFRSFMDRSWEIKVEFDSIDKLVSPVKTTWKGFIMQRRD